MKNTFSSNLVVEQSFYHELNMSFDHQYLVTLKGYCSEIGALVHEYLGGGDLEMIIQSPELRSKHGLK